MCGDVRTWLHIDLVAHRQKKAQMDAAWICNLKQLFADLYGATFEIATVRVNHHTRLQRRQNAALVHVIRLRFRVQFEQTDEGARFEVSV